MKKEIQIKPFESLTLHELYSILKNRQDVFIVEQRIIYRDLDEKDFQSIHFWIQGDTPSILLAYLRMILYPEEKEVSIGRVLTIPSSRGKGLSRQLMEKAIEYWRATYSSWSLHLHAQEYLQDFYKSLGFEVAGPSFFYPDEDPLTHVPMVYKK